MDLAVRRDFPIHERLKLQFRAEAFNIFNHPNFGVINPNWYNYLWAIHGHAGEFVGCSESAVPDGRSALDAVRVEADFLGELGRNRLVHGLEALMLTSGVLEYV